MQIVDATAGKWWAALCASLGIRSPSLYCSCKSAGAEFVLRKEIPVAVRAAGGVHALRKILLCLCVLPRILFFLERRERGVELQGGKEKAAATTATTRRLLLSYSSLTSGSTIFAQVTLKCVSLSLIKGRC